MEYLNFILFSLIGIIAYFVRDILGQFKEHRKSSDQQHLHFSEEVGKLKGKISLTKYAIIPISENKIKFKYSII